MNWNYIIGPISVLMGVLISLYVKDRAKEAAETEFGKNIKAALAVFKLELIESLDGTYARCSENKLISDAQADRIDVHEIRISKIEARIDDIKQIMHNPKTAC